MSEIRRPRSAARSVVRLLAAILVLPGAAAAQEDARDGGILPAPPDTQEETVIDSLHGEAIEDPYRWLEEREAPETRAWIEAQNAHADAVLSSLPERDALRGLSKRLLEVDVMSTPIAEGGRYFYSRRRAGEDLAVLYWREGPEGEERVLLDPHPMSEDHTTSVEYLDVSEAGTRVAYAVRRGGVDEVEVRLRSVDTGRDLPDALPTGRYAGVTLTPDGEGLYYARYGGEEPRVYHHALGTDPARDRPVFGAGYGPEAILVPSLSEDGRRLMVHVLHGSSGPTEIHLRDRASDGPFVPVIADGESRSFASFAGDRLAIVTDRGAPNRRVLTADLDAPSVEWWRELVPERDDAVVEEVSPVGGRFFVSYMEDVQPRVAEYDAAGRRLGEIAFETLGSVGAVSGDWGDTEGFFTFSSFHVPPTIHRLDTATGERSVWFETRVPIDADSMEVRQVWYDSRDGTRIPMFLVYRKGLQRTGETPVYLTGYGGFDVSRVPEFTAMAAAWVELGGLYALPSLRGGGEFGEAWHRAGMLGNKQNTFDDFIAAAEWLIQEGFTRPERLAIGGGSNGGLLVGAAVTQRPELFGAAVVTYPLLDMLRYHRFLVAPFWVPEYGSADDPEQFRWLRAYSPYHNVRSGTEYPATLFITGDGDTRVDPLHARKMAARLQEARAGATVHDGRGGTALPAFEAASRAEAGVARPGAGAGGESRIADGPGPAAAPAERAEPVLLRHHTKAGHAGGRPVSRQVDDMVDTLSFLVWQVGGGIERGIGAVEAAAVEAEAGEGEAADGEAADHSWP